MIQPEVRLAQRLVEIRKLEPPVDIRSLVAEFAVLYERPFPDFADIDGICLGLKRPRKRPIVIVNNRKHWSRVRFTLAHELGHILIPWHTGNIFDSTSHGHVDEISDYWSMEAEANRFASELLMPASWVREKISLNTQPPDAVAVVSKLARTSSISAALKVISCLPAGYVFAEVLGESGVRLFKSPGTLASLPFPIEREQLQGALNWASDRWVRSTSTGAHWWWNLNFPEEILTAPSESWREILKTILNDIVDPTEMAGFRSSLNGVLSNANNRLRERRSKERLRSICLQRLHSYGDADSRYLLLISHPKFDAFLDGRIIDFFS